jgi:hypothetical protein
LSASNKACARFRFWRIGQGYPIFFSAIVPS